MQSLVLILILMEDTLGVSECMSINNCTELS